MALALVVYGTTMFGDALRVRQTAADATDGPRNQAQHLSGYRGLATENGRTGCGSLGAAATGLHLPAGEYYVPPAPRRVSPLVTLRRGPA